MAKTNWQDPKSSEIRSTHISGLQEAVGKLEESIGLETVAGTDIPLTEVFISNDDRCRIYQAPEGKRNWLLSPAPVIKKNGVVITDDFEIDYGGGAVIFTTPISESDILTADATYTKKIDDKQLEILSNKIDNLAGEGRTTQTVKGNADKIGNLSTLKTNAKSDLVNAINEVKDIIDDISLEAENVSYNNTDSGLEASNVQAAIDEVKDELDAHKAETIHQGKHNTLEATNTDDATSVTDAPLKSAGGLAVAKSFYLGGDFSKSFTLLGARFLSFISNGYTPIANIPKTDGMMLSIDIIGFLQGIGRVAISYKAMIEGTNVYIMRKDIAGISQTDVMKVEVEGDECVVYVKSNSSVASSTIRVIIEVFTPGDKNIRWLY